MTQLPLEYCEDDANSESSNDSIVSLDPDLECYEDDPQSSRPGIESTDEPGSPTRKDPPIHEPSDYRGCGAPESKLSLLAQQLDELGLPAVVRYRCSTQSLLVDRLSTHSNPL